MVFPIVSWKVRKTLPLLHHEKERLSLTRLSLFSFLLLKGCRLFILYYQFNGAKNISFAPPTAGWLTLRVVQRIGVGHIQQWSNLIPLRILHYLMIYLLLPCNVTTLSSFSRTQTAWKKWKKPQKNILLKTIPFAENIPHPLVKSQRNCSYFRITRPLSDYWAYYLYVLFLLIIRMLWMILIYGGIWNTANTM